MPQRGLDSLTRYFIDIEHDLHFEMQLQMPSDKQVQTHFEVLKLVI